MGFFDKFLKAIGFESVEDDGSEKKNKKQRITSSKFDLRNKNAKEEVKKEQKTVEVNTPTNQEDIEKISLRLLEEENVLVNLSNFSEEDKKRALDFLSGASYVLKFKIKQIEDNLFFISKNNGEDVE